MQILEVRLTERETTASAFFSSLLDEGLSCARAIATTKARYPHLSRSFQDWLTN